MFTIRHLPFTVHHHTLDRQPVAGEHQRIEARLVAVPGEHRVVVVKRDEIGRRAAADPCNRLAARPGAAFDRTFEQLAADMGASERRDVARLRREPLPVFQPAQFLERVDRDVAVRADREPAAVPEVVRQREQPVAEIGFRARAHADDGAGSGQLPGFVGIHVRRVHEAPLIVDVGVLEQPPHRASLVGREALVDLALLLRNVQVNRAGRLPARRRDGRERRCADGAQAVRADADGELRTLLRSCRIVVFEKSLQRQGEQLLRTLGPRRVEAGAFIEDGNVSQPDAHVSCRCRQRLEHRHAVRTGGRITVQVVELDDGRVAALQHLRVDLRGDGVQQAEAGDDATRGDRVPTARRTGDDLVDSAVADAQQDVVGPAVGQQRFPCKNRSHRGTLKLYIQASPC